MYYSLKMVQKLKKNQLSNIVFFIVIWMPAPVWRQHQTGKAVNTTIKRETEPLRSIGWERIILEQMIQHTYKISKFVDFMINIIERSLYPTHSAVDTSENYSQ